MNQHFDEKQDDTGLSEFLAAELDPDAAELLRDLEDDDETNNELSEEAEMPRLSNPSLASVMAATPSTILDGVASQERSLSLGSAEFPSISRSHPSLAPVAKAEQASETEADMESDAMAQEEFLAGKTIPQLMLVQLAKPASDAEVEEAVADNGDEEESYDSEQELSGNEIEENEQSSADKPKPPLPSAVNEKQQKSSSSEKLATVDAEGKTAESKAVSRPPRKPSAPPPVPAQAPQRMLKDNEIALTTEALSAMCAGGLLDEAHDLEKHSFTDNSWYTQIFNDDFLRTIPSDVDRQSRRETKFIIDRLGMQEGARMLDLCCGYGRHTLLMSQQGFDMVGFDLSMIMLKKALADAQKSGLSIKFVHGDMQKLSFKSIFDGIYNVQTSFGYFNDQKNFKVLQGILHALKPGGRFLIETINRDFFVDQLPHRVFWKGVDCTLFEEVDIDHFLGVLKVKRSFVFNDSVRAPWEQYINIRLYTAAELRGLLLRAGFDIIELSGGYSLPGAFFGAQSPRIIFVAERPIK
ncbi:MAG: class I SAM-dependent methyltransferase [Bradymonadales bacterium]|jgi:SAM-dependent methyltransferase